MNKVILSMENVTFGYSDQAWIVDHCTKKFFSNSIYVLLGKNGIGKTTLLNLLVGNLIPVKGELRYSIDLNCVGYMSDEFFYYEGMTVLDMVYVVCILRNIDKNSFEERLKEYIKLLDLDEYKKTKIADLSFGTKKRVHLLLTVLHDPKLIILDEPTNGLDPGQIVNFKNNIKALKAEGKTIIISTHSLKIAEDIADNRVILANSGLLDIDDGADLEEAYLKLS